MKLVREEIYRKGKTLRRVAGGECGEGRVWLLTGLKEGRRWRQRWVRQTLLNHHMFSAFTIFLGAFLRLE